MLQDQSRNRTPMPAAQPPAETAPPEPGPARAETGIARMLSAPATSPNTVSPELAQRIAACEAADTALKACGEDIPRGLVGHGIETRKAVISFPSAGTADTYAKARCLGRIWSPDLMKEDVAFHLAAGDASLDSLAVAIAAEFVGLVHGPADASALHGDVGLLALGQRFDALHTEPASPAPVESGTLPPAATDESTRAILDAIQAHEQAWQAYSRASAAYDALGDAPGQTPASDEEIAAAEEAATDASCRSDQAWRDLFKVRPQCLHELWMLLTHVERHHRDHHGMEDAPDIWGTLTGTVAALRTESKAPSAPQHDLSKLSVLHLSRLYEICRQQRDILLTIEGASMCEERDGSGYNALGNLVEAEGERFSFLSDDVVHELERRRPSGTEERNYILEVRVNHRLTCNGYIEPELVAEIAAAWGAK